MVRIYREEQRAAIKGIREDLIEELESTYLKTFNKLNEIGLGEGMVIRLTQTILLSRDAAISPLRDDIEEIDRSKK